MISRKMPGKCYREVNGEQRKGVRATRKNGKGYCKLIRKKERGERVGFRYGKVIYTSARGSLFYYNAKGNKTYLRPKQIRESVSFDPPDRKRTTSSYLRNNEAPVIRGHIPATKQKTVSAQGTVSKIEANPLTMDNFHPQLPVGLRDLTVEQRRIYYANIKILEDAKFPITRLKELTRDHGMKNVNNNYDSMVIKASLAAARKNVTYTRDANNPDRDKEMYDSLAATVQTSIKKFSALIENKHTAEELRGIIKKGKMGTAAKKNKQEMAVMIATYYRNEKPWKLNKYDS